MIHGATLRLVLLISCAHAMVHVYELSLPSVELRIADEYRPEDVQAGKELTGMLSWWWRLPWGLGALGAGWLVDRFGSRRMLALYLLGVSATCLIVGVVQDLSLLFVTMFSMGALASIYHPAGLALISHETRADNRTRALGLHGIFGSLGIGFAPFAVGSLLAAGLTWRQYYGVLAIPGILLGLLFGYYALRHERRVELPAFARTASTSASVERPAWGSFFILTCVAVLQGFIYSAVLAFLPRYLSDWQPSGFDLSNATRGNYLASGVLLAGCLGQYLSGRLAKPHLLERQMAFVMYANVPFLLWMAYAQDLQRVWAAGAFAIIHFMHQPIYNSLIAKYTSRARRSLCYGFSFAMGLGIGGAGAFFAGTTTHESTIYGMLAGIAFAAGTIGLELRRRSLQTVPS